MQYWCLFWNDIWPWSPRHSYSSPSKKTRFCFNMVQFLCCTFSSEQVLTIYIKIQSNLAIRNFLVALKLFFLLHPDVAKSLPCWLSQFSFSKLRQPTGQRLSNVRTQQTKISIGPILFLYYEESLMSSNLNSIQLRFHGVRPRGISILGEVRNVEI